ncbi:MAG: hypothetical protein VYB32_02530 [Pseudomonadota bacterium]|nr:hypothetical protein [Pseudomonadota bacterium]
MKKYIHLTSPAYLNAGAYVDAGADVPVGNDKLEITEERAEAIEAGLRGTITEVDDEPAGDGEDSAEATPARSRSRGK